MATIVDHDAITALLAETWGAIAELYAGLDAAAYERPTCLPGWSVKDQLSHLTATELGLTGEPAPEVDVSHLTHLRNPIATLNEMWVESMRSLPGPEVLDRFRDVTDRRLEALAAMTQADFDAPSWTPAGPDETYGRFMRIRHYDSYVHEQDAREALRAPSATRPTRWPPASTRRRRRSGSSSGARRRSRRGSGCRSSSPGRCRGPIWWRSRTGPDRWTRSTARRRSASGSAARSFLRLTAGRRDAADHLGTDIVLLGDQDLARQLATNLAYTI